MDGLEDTYTPPIRVPACKWDCLLTWVLTEKVSVLHASFLNVASSWDTFTRSYVQICRIEFGLSPCAPRTTIVFDS